MAQQVRISHTVDGVPAEDITLKVEDVPQIVAHELVNSLSFVATRAGGRVVTYERAGDGWEPLE